MELPSRIDLRKLSVEMMADGVMMYLFHGWETLNTINALRRE